MERDQRQAQKLLELAYVPEAEIRRAYADPRRGPQFDLCAVLQSLGLLSPEQGQWVRQSTSQNPGQMTQVHSASAMQQSSSGSALIQNVSQGSGSGSSQSQSLIQSQSGTLNPGDKIGPYSIVRKIGQGGMGMVFEARHETLDQRVALKTVISGAELDEEQLERFEIEAQAMARLRHPNIVRVLDVAILNPMTYMAMEFVSGGDLQQLIREQRVLDQRLAAELGEKLARALFHAHRQSIIHRDMKPANVLLDASNEPYITDFGLAKQVEDSSRGLTKTGDFLGTPVYMAPEQIENRDFPDGRMDIYALGVTLYEMVTGSLPFEGATAINIVNQVLNSEPRPPSQLRPDLDPDLETIILKCMQKERELRYHDARDLAKDLKAFLNNEAISARRLTTMERFQKWQRRNKGLTRGVVGIAVVATILLFAGGLFSFRAIMSERDAKEREATTAEQLRQDAEKQRKEVAIKANFALASVALERGYSMLSQNRCRDAGLAFMKVVTILQKKKEETGRINWTEQEDALLDSAELGFREAAVRTGYVNNVAGGDTNSGVLDRDGRTFVSYQTEGGRTHIIRSFDCVDNKENWKTEDLGGTVSSIRIAADSKRFVVSVNDSVKKFSQLQMRDMKTGAIIWKRDFPVEGAGKNPIGPLDFSHDKAGQYLCTGGWPNTYVLETNSGKILRTFDSRQRKQAQYPNPTYSVSFSDDDRLVASAYPDGTMSFWELSSGRQVWWKNFGRVRYAQFLSRVVPERPYRFVLTSHDGRVSVFALNKRGVLEQTLMLVSGEYGDCTFLYQSMSKRLFAAGFDDGTLVIWNNEGFKISTLVHPGLTNCTISQDDRFVVTVGEGSPRRWRIDRVGVFLGNMGPVTFVDNDHVANVITDQTGAPKVKIVDYQGVDEKYWTMDYDPRDAGVIVTDLEMTPDLKHLVLIRRPFNTQSDQTSRIEIWPVNGETRPRVLRQMNAHSIAFSNDGSMFALGLDQSFRQKDPDFAIVKKFSDGSIVKTLGPSVQGIHNLAFTKDGKKLVTASLDGTAAVYELEGSQQSPTRLFEIVSNQSYRYVDAEKRPIRKDPKLMSFGEVRKNFRRLFGRVATNRQSIGRMGIFSLCLSPDESTLVLGGGDAFGRIFKLNSDGPGETLAGHEHRLLFASFAQRGELLITASTDGVIRVWNWRSRRVLRTIKTDLPLISLALSPDNKRLAGVTSANAVWVWELHIPKIQGFRSKAQSIFNKKFPPASRR